ncbi:MAG TPA: FHA domain-containing serine/threonine-protein kinase [Vicinamibacteria bacterium]|nr:FHA domain-containing serine/threonine-protein kinase [Vicinamibacteria bacterium]
MSGRVSLDVVAGPIQGRHFEFEGHDTFLFGRSPDCHAELAANDTTASRHHFLLEVNPPAARLRDLGSLNGTYVNGNKHGGRERHLTPEEAADKPWPQVDLRDGDLIRVGATVINVRIDGGPAPSPPPRTPSDIGLLVELESSSKTSPPAGVAGYALGPLLGRGGMGVVHLATRLSDGGTVALKLMRPEAAVDAHAREVFDREIAVTESLRHPNVVTLYAHGAHGDTFFFAMEYCPGGSLSAALLQRANPLDPALATRVALQALEGLSFAHEKGFIHRDIKPENILLADMEMNVVKLTDFGLAKSFQQAGLSGMTATGFAAGTLQFMPREQLTNFRLLRPASDVWSMGATLYYMLTLRYVRDFTAGKDPLAVVLGGNVLPIRTRNPQIPAALAEVVDRAVDDDLIRRYPSGVEFRNALRQAL